MSTTFCQIVSLFLKTNVKFKTLGLNFIEKTIRLRKVLKDLLGLTRQKIENYLFSIFSNISFNFLNL